jgi:hypothetical protein
MEFQMALDNFNNVAVPALKAAADALIAKAAADGSALAQAQSDLANADAAATAAIQPITDSLTTAVPPAA